MRSSTTLQAVVVGSLLVFAGTAVGLEAPKAPGAKPGAGASRQLEGDVWGHKTGGSRPQSSAGAGKKTASPPKKGTRATGDEDETDDLEIQRNKRTVQGASAPKGVIKGPKTPSQAKGNNAAPVKGPKPPPPPQDKNAIPVKIPR